MKVLYIGKHGQPNNDDEGAISRALKTLGHDVLCVPPGSCIDHVTQYDIALFHGLDEGLLNQIHRKIKCVLWYFDAINKGFGRNDAYVNSMLPYLHAGFFTDGDFVRSIDKPNIHDLKQGFDDYHKTISLDVQESRDLLFIGTSHINGYEERREYIDKLTEWFGPMNWPHYTIFKDELTKVCQGTKIMLGMPPVTNHYWSNRIYLLGGRGACIVHPFSSRLVLEFGSSVSFFNTPEEAKLEIEILLKDKKRRDMMRQNVQKIIMDRHCYLHRVEELLCKI